jgi:hypothetical protein
VKGADDKCIETGSCRGYHLGAIGEIHYLEKVKAAEYKRTENGTEEDIDWKQLKINSKKVRALECIYIQRTKE